MTLKKIESAKLFVIRLTLKVPFGTSYGLVTQRESLVLRLTYDGQHGFGECAAFSHPFYSSETVKTAHHISKDYLIPEALELTDVDLRKIDQAFSSVRGHRMAKAMVENALYDLLAKTRGVPLFDLIGGTLKKVRSGIAIGTHESMDELLGAVERAAVKKYHRIKIKIKPGADIEPLRAIRRAFPDIALSVDANGCYTLDDLTKLKELDEFNLDMIEQPLPPLDLSGHRSVRAALSTPICLDESIECIEDLKTAQTLKSLDILNIKQSRVGGLKNSIEIHDYCREAGLGMWSGGMLETGIGRAVNIHLQTLEGFDIPGDTSETSRYFDEDITDPPVVLDDDGFIEVPKGSGIGVEVDNVKLNRHCVTKEKIEL